MQCVMDGMQGGTSTTSAMHELTHYSGGWEGSTWALAEKTVTEIIHLDRDRDGGFSVHISCDSHTDEGYLFVPGSFMPGAFPRADRPYRHEPVRKSAPSTTT